MKLKPNQPSFANIVLRGRMQPLKVVILNKTVAAQGSYEVFFSKSNKFPDENGYQYQPKNSVLILKDYRPKVFDDEFLWVGIHPNAHINSSESQDIVIKFSFNKEPLDEMGSANKAQQIENLKKQK